MQSRLAVLLEQAGVKVGVLKSSVKPELREKWISDNGPKCDCIISQIDLVKTGVDFFDVPKRYNFPSIAFAQQNYSVYSLRQASRRAWRIGQDQPCKVAFFYFRGTMQERAIALIGKKVSAALALEGQFSSEGLAAMSGDDGDVSMALARSLVENMDEGDARRAWGKVGGDVALMSARSSAVSSAVVEVAEVEEPSILAFRDKRGQGLLWELN